MCNRASGDFKASGGDFLVDSGVQDGVLFGLAGFIRRPIGAGWGEQCGEGHWSRSPLRHSRGPLQLGNSSRNPSQEYFSPLRQLVLLTLLAVAAGLTAAMTTSLVKLKRNRASWYGGTPSGPLPQLTESSPRRTGVN